MGLKKEGITTRKRSIKRKILFFKKTGQQVDRPNEQLVHYPLSHSVTMREIHSVGKRAISQNLWKLGIKIVLLQYSHINYLQAGNPSVHY